MKKTTKALTTIGTVVASTFAVGAVNAASNPFAITELGSGYMQVAESDKAGEMKCGSKMNKQQEAACGEGKCGAMMESGKMKKGMESACGAMMKGKEGACGDMKAKPAAKSKGYSGGTSGWGNRTPEKTAPASMKKAKEGKCGEGKCGGMMQGNEMKKGMEAMCGGMMKGKEGSCGMGMKGE